MILIIGYGNTLRGDDGVGQHIARRLDVGFYREEVQVIACYQLAPELVESVSRAHLVIFVDASEDGQAGEIRCREIQPEVAVGAFTHNVNSATLLAASRDLYGVSPRGMAISIGGIQFGYGEGLSPPVEKAVPEVMKHIYQLIEANEDFPTKPVQSQKLLEE